MELSIQLTLLTTDDLLSNHLSMYANFAGRHLKPIKYFVIQPDTVNLSEPDFIKITPPAGLVKQVISQLTTNPLCKSFSQTTPIYPEPLPQLQAKSSSRSR